MKPENEEIIKKFLLGEMPETERFDFEEQFITDADLFEEIKVVEDELIEKYVRGWMNPAERSKFEQNFLTTNKRHERVEFLRQMINKIEDQSEAVGVKKNVETASPESVWDRLTALFLTPKIALASSLALILAVFGVWIFYTNFGGTAEIVKNENNKNVENLAETKIPQPIVSPVKLPENNQNNSENVNNNRTNNENNLPKPPLNSDENINKSATSPKENTTKTPTPTTAPNPILALFSGTIRSNGKNNLLNLPKEAKAATLQLNLEANDYKIYLAQLTDADGNVIFQRSNLTPRKSKINFNIPAKNLKKGDYIIKLFGKNKAGENESVADFQFRVNQ